MAESGREEGTRPKGNGEGEEEVRPVRYKGFHKYVMKPVKLENYLAQLHSAGKWEEEFNKNLLATGWIYHPETGHWSHPDGTAEIWPG